MVLMDLQANVCVANGESNCVYESPLLNACRAVSS
jgi:hypothetical protein